MYTIDTNIFYQGCRDLIAYVQTAQVEKYAHPTQVAFDIGWFKEHEGYKSDVWKKAQIILEYKSWQKETIHTQDLVGRIARCIDIKTGHGKKQNLITWREAADDGANSLKKVLLARKELSEDAIYQIFCGGDDEQAFNNATSVWGEKYPFISFLFFLKDMNNYAPVRPKIMRPRLAQLGIETDCLKTCTWKNYQEFIQILKQIQNLMNERIPTPSLIDAHSFLWSMWVLEPSQQAHNHSQSDVQEREQPRIIIGDDREAVVKVRINQSKFRKRLLKRYKGCCLCGLSNPDLLIASHIQPWRNSDKNEKVDDDNGLLLCPNHDQLFDKGFITFSDDGEMIISDKLSENDRALTNVLSTKRIELSVRGRDYMRFHRNKVFKNAGSIREEAEMNEQG